MSVDAFAASLSKGVRLRRPRLTEAVRIGAVFGITEATAPVIGWLLGIAASRYIEAVDHWIAFVILGGVGCKMIYESLKGPSEEEHVVQTFHVLFITAIGTSIDSVAVGVTLALMDSNIVLMSVLIGSATFLMSTIGVIAGHYIGMKAGRIAECVGGLCLIAIGTTILCNHLGIEPLVNF